MASLTHISFASSNIRSAGYDADECTLEIAFHSGGVYRYLGVSLNVWDAFQRASSKGSYFHDWIKDRYRHVKLR